MAAPIENGIDIVSFPPHVATVTSLPPTLTLTGARMLLKTPTPKDDAVMCEIFSHPATVENLPFFYRSGGWTVEEMASRREKQIMDQLQGKGLTLYMHLLNKKDSRGNETSPLTKDNEEDMTLIGTTGFRCIDIENGTGEIGIILHPLYWRKGLATEAMYLCLRYAFESLGLQRVDWLTSGGNGHMRGWCEAILQLKPFPVPAMELEGWVGYSMLQPDWHNRGRHILEGKIFSKGSLQLGGSSED